jgi:large repetitive protein
VRFGDARRRCYRPVGRTRSGAFVIVATLAWACTAEAQYTQRFLTISDGAVTFTGNSLGLDGETSQNGQGTRGAIGTFITTDTTQRDTTPPPTSAPPFPFGTTNDWRLNGSQAVLRLPAGSRVLHAELIWGGSFAGPNAADNVSAFLDDPVAFTTPAGTFNVTPDPATAKSAGTPSGAGTCTACFYVRTASVTTLVAAGGAGTYSTGRVPATQGTLNNNNASAGWTLAVVYEDFTQPVRSLSLLLGLEAAGGAAASVSGFCTPPSGPVAGRLAVSALEGDANITGDKLLFGRSPLNNGDRVSGPRNPKDNFFSSQITRDDGSLETAGTFGDRNHTPGSALIGARQGWDITNVDVANRLRNNQTSALTRGITDGDSYQILALGLQVDVDAPHFASTGTLSVDRATAAIGDVLTTRFSSTTRRALRTRPTSSSSIRFRPARRS